MIKFLSKLDECRYLLGLMLSEENVKRLRAGQPIHLYCEQVGSLPWKGEIVIGYSETEEKIIEDMKQHIGPQTIIHKEPRNADA